MTEKQRMLAGEMYDPSDPVLSEERYQARLRFQRFNSLAEDHFKERCEVLGQLLPNAGSELHVEPPFYCDYGYNIYLGDMVYINFNCCILDVMPVRIGDRVMIAPAVQILTATHPLNAKERSSGREFAKPVTIGDDVWLGGGAIVCPGITIGKGAVVGAGAVVTKDVPENSLVAGNPARVIRLIQQDQY